ncbi:MAG TPA: xanthine dehydrogenase molybdopterin binding subunit [Bacteroidales bacterium]|nr:xanthine dehydrogenase molybdopterin binding subunit [Bacteroidales bacterium]HSA44341.1 xanthine dehydrogenase molybdopterin binding subunit [Bacteroidales bacterium]
MNNPGDHSVSHSESNILHVTGMSRFTGDLAQEMECLFGKVVFSKYAHARISGIDITKTLQAPGVQAVISAADIPGSNQTGPVFHDEPCLAEDTVQCIGQAILLIAATCRPEAEKAAETVNISYEPLPAILELEDAMQYGEITGRERWLKRGDTHAGFEQSEYLIEGQIRTGAQEHWYLETQASLAIPGEAGEILIHSSTQHPSETQAIVAEVLGIPRNKVTVEVHRMGGAFGGKETQANPVAAWAALLAVKCGKPVLLQLSRQDDQRMTGKRHRFLSTYKAGFTAEGKILAYEASLHGDAGCTADLSGAILERALFHTDNAYYIPNISVTGRMWKTNHPSNTAFRGFGGPQGMAVIEQVIDRIARFLGKDPLEIRQLNLYQGVHNVTHYGQEIQDNHLEAILQQLIHSASYYQRRKEINEFNSRNAFFKKGMALTPVKFGISFTTSYLNQAGALVHIYQDGSILLSHGGTEMGQGLHTKIRGIAAREMGVAEVRIRVAPTNTSRVPNTSATAASSGSDLNGMAVKDAIDKLKYRISEAVAGSWTSDGKASRREEILFANDKVSHRSDADLSMSFEAAVQLAYKSKRSLSATGYYATPGLAFDPMTGKGHPFHYFAFGAAVSEVLLDVLTGRVSLLRTDILHDTGTSLNPDIDKGQIAGGYVQGLGWCTSEIIRWDQDGRLLNHGPDTYKIPTIGDIPAAFNIALFPGSHQPTAIHGSKAVGEPPLMLAFSAWLAVKDAISAVASHRKEPEFELPASVDTILQAIFALNQTNTSDP